MRKTAMMRKTYPFFVKKVYPLAIKQAGLSKNCNAVAIEAGLKSVPNGFNSVLNRFSSRKAPILSEKQEPIKSSESS